MNAHRPVRAAALPAPPPSETELERVRSDPRVARLGKILALGDALLLTGLRIRYSLEGGGVTLADETLETFSCARGALRLRGGEAVTAADLRRLDRRPRSAPHGRGDAHHRRPLAPARGRGDRRAGP